MGRDKRTDTSARVIMGRLDIGPDQGTTMTTWPGTTRSPDIKTEIGRSIQRARTIQTIEIGLDQPLHPEGGEVDQKIQRCTDAEKEQVQVPGGIEVIIPTQMRTENLQIIMEKKRDQDIQKKPDFH